MPLISSGTKATLDYLAEGAKKQLPGFVVTVLVMGAMVFTEQNIIEGAFRCPCFKNAAEKGCERSIMYGCMFIGLPALIIFLLAVFGSTAAKLFFRDCRCLSKRNQVLATALNDKTIYVEWSLTQATAYKVQFKEDCCCSCCCCGWTEKEIEFGTNPDNVEKGVALISVPNTSSTYAVKVTEKESNVELGEVKVKMPKGENELHIISKFGTNFAIAVDSTSLALSWDTQPNQEGYQVFYEDGLGEERGYRFLHYDARNDGDEKQYHIIRGLNQNRKYTVFLRQGNAEHGNVGHGEATTEHMDGTGEVTVVHNGPNSLRVSWDLPKGKKTRALRYLISYKSEKETERVGANADGGTAAAGIELRQQVNADNENDEGALEVIIDKVGANLQKGTKVITGLREGVKYNVKVEKIHEDTEVGEAVEVEETQRLVAASRRNNGKNINIAWNSQAEDDRIYGHRISYHPKTANEQQKYAIVKNEESGVSRKACNIINLERPEDTTVNIAEIRRAATVIGLNSDAETVVDPGHCCIVEHWCSKKAAITTVFQAIFITIAWLGIVFVDGNYLACAATCTPYVTHENCTNRQNIPFSEEYKSNKVISQYVGIGILGMAGLLYLFHLVLKSECSSGLYDRCCGWSWSCCCYCDFQGTSFQSCCFCIQNAGVGYCCCGKCKCRCDGKLGYAESKTVAMADHQEGWQSNISEGRVVMIKPTRQMVIEDETSNLMDEHIQQVIKLAGESGTAEVVSGKVKGLFAGDAPKDNQEDRQQMSA